MEKTELLKVLKNKLSEFKDNLDMNNITEFESLKKEIADLLSDEQKKRFNRINFYSQEEDHSYINDHLPF